MQAKPLSVSRFNRRHPLTHLHGCWTNWRGSGCRNLVTRLRDLTAVSAVPTVIGTGLGPASRHVRASNHLLTASNFPNSFEPVTVALVFRLTATTAGNALIVSRRNFDAGHLPMWQLYENAGVIYWFCGRPGDATFYYRSWAGAVLNRWHIVVATYDASGTLPNLYGDVGTTGGVLTDGPHAAPTATTFMSVGAGGPTPANGASVDILDLKVWYRELSRADVGRYMADPWALYRRPPVIALPPPPPPSFKPWLPTFLSRRVA